MRSCGELDGPLQLKVATYGDQETSCTADCQTGPDRINTWKVYSSFRVA
jgi:hypothetical protein